MPIESTVTEASSHSMRNGDLYTSKNGTVVLVTAAPMNQQVEEKFTGVVLHSSDDWHRYPIGFHSDKWAIECFKPFHGTLTLESTP